MTFSEYRRTLQFDKLSIQEIPLNLIKCQYNFDYERVWLKVCGDYDIKSTPYYHYLLTGKTDKYFELFRGYGRSEVWITNNIIKFNALVDDIKKNGIKNYPEVVDKPIVENRYSKAFEIWEGHRRLSIALFLNIKQKVQLVTLHR